ncbi:MAG: hypothetical protein ABIJ45_07925, partial [Candidatus Zixiibacteriota bacterium]
MMLGSSKRGLRQIVNFAVTILLGLFIFTAVNAEQSEDDLYDIKLANAQAGLRILQGEEPAVKAYWSNNRITRLYGTAFSYGRSPLESAENFRLNHSQTLNALPNELRQASRLGNKSNIQPLMYNPTTGEYKFTLVYYAQYRDDIPVYGSELRLLVRNEPNYPVVLAVSTLRELDNFNPSDKSPVDFEFAKSTIRVDNSDLMEFKNIETVIWAGIEDRDEEPKLAVTMTGHNDFPESWRYVIDAATGEILYKEDLIVFEDITGNISGLATDGDAAEQCENEITMPLPYARASVGTNIVYTDISGDYVITDVGSDSVTVYSEIYGQYFVVYNEAGSESILSRKVLPPASADFLHN